MITELKNMADYTDSTDYIFPGKGTCRFVARKSLCIKFKKIIKS